MRNSHFISSSFLSAAVSAPSAPRRSYFHGGLGERAESMHQNAPKCLTLANRLNEKPDVRGCPKMSDSGRCSEGLLFRCISLRRFQQFVAADLAGPAPA